MRSLLTVVLLAMLSGVFIEAASPPVPQNLMSPQQAVVGTPVTISVAASDVDGNLSSIHLYYRDMNGSTGPWVGLGSTSVSGGYGEFSATWTPPGVGDFEVHAGVYDTGGLHHGNAGVWLINPVEVVDDAPVPELLEFPRYAFIGETYRITGSGSDADGNLDQLNLYYDDPSAGYNWVSFTGWVASNGGYYGSIAGDWTPTTTGTYKLHLGVKDADGQTHDSHESGSIYVVEVVMSDTPVPPSLANLSTPADGYVGEPVYISARATDLNEDLDYIQFYSDYPSAWTPIGEPVPLSSGDDTAGVIWKPTTNRTYKIRAGVYDGTGLAHDDTANWNTVSVSATPPGAPPPPPEEDLIIQGALTIDSGEEYNVVHDANVATSGSVIVKNDGSAIVWASGRVTLGQGFTASPGASGAFVVVIDSDMDGRSDLDENVDSDGDGMLDGYEYEIIDYSLFDGITSLSQVSGSGDFDGDGVTNATEVANGTSPAGLSAGQSSAYEGLLVLPIPESPDYRVVDTETLISD